MRESLKKYFFFRKIRSWLPASFSSDYHIYTCYRDFITDSEKYTLEESREFQFKKVKSLIQYCWEHNEGYRAHWEKGNFHPDKFQEPDDIRHVPFISKDLIRRDIKKFTNKGIKKIVYQKTGGTTGSPFNFFEEKKVAMIEKAFMHNLWSRFYPEINLKTKRTIIRGKKVKNKIDYDPMHGLLLSSFNITPDNIKLFIHAIDKYKTPIIHAYPSSLYIICRIMRQHNLKLSHKFESIMLGSEKLFDFQRETIYEILGAPICHWYGQAEKVVLAGNNINDNLFHIYPQYGLAEVLTKNGAKAKPGETGEIIGTNLWNMATPFIRYRTFDRGEKGHNDIDGYNISYPVLKSIEGRLQDIIIGKSKNMISLVNVANICAQFPDVEQFQFAQQKPGELIVIYKKLIKDSHIDTKKIYDLFKLYLGDEFNISLDEAADLQTTASGKFLYLKQELDIESFL